MTPAQRLRLYRGLDTIRDVLAGMGIALLIERVWRSFP